MKKTLNENIQTEFKSSFNDAAIESLSAFANTKGGTVYIGLSDNGTPIKGFSIGTETLQTWANEVKNKTQPSIIPDVLIRRIDGVDIGELRVPEFPIKPISFKGRYYKRVNNSNHLLSPHEISDLSLHSLQLSWDSYPAHGKTLDDLDNNAIEKFITKVNLAGRFQLHTDVKTSLEKLKLINGDEITNAAWLLFGKDNVGYNVHLGRFKTPTFIIDDRMYSGALFQTVDDIMQYLIGQIKVAFEITGKTTQRTEIFEYPLTALREIALNCLIHRDYRSPIDVQIKVFDNYISFFNPGKLMGDLTIDDLQHDNYRAYARNKLIAEAFYLTGDIEKYGSGFLRVRNEIASYPTMELTVEEIPNGLHVKLEYINQKTTTLIKEGNKEGDKEGDILSTNQQKILKAIYSDKNVTIPELSKTVGINETNIQKNLKRLRELNKIERVGPAKGGYWKIIE